MKTENIISQKRRAVRFVWAYGVLAVLIVLLVIWNINAGSVSVSVKEIGEILFLRRGDETAYNIIWEIRLPRIIAAAVLGGALAVAGFLLQTFFRNPIAGPFVLGISSGAKLMVALVLIFFMRWKIAVDSGVLIGAAFAGALISMGFVMLVSARVQRMSMLIVAGIMIGYICSAITDFVVTFAQDADIVNLHNWSLGSFSGMDWGDVAVMSVVVAAAFATVFLLSKPLGAYQLGEAYAQNMGVNIRLLRLSLILLSSLLAGCVTAFAGPVSFVGIAVPHLVKRLLGTAKPLVVIPAGFLGGAVFCLFCDLIARTLFAPTELSISSVTAVFGAPIVIMIMLKRQK